MKVLHILTNYCRSLIEKLQKYTILQKISKLSHCTNKKLHTNREVCECVCVYDSTTKNY